MARKLKKFTVVVMNDVKVVGRDPDGLVLGDNNQDHCYIYFDEIPDVIKLLRREYFEWRNPE